jgi:DNA-directed RNA polymerase subunit RPC12/RpoP
MAKCDYCGSTIIMGGVRVGQQRFCNNKCRNNAYILSVSQNVPPDVLEKQIEEVWRGNCPKCRGLGPVDVHKSYQIWSALVLTRWTSNQQLSCRSCGTKRQTSALFFSLFCGWWGFPWGLILTPVQVTRNIVQMTKGPDSSTPSADLRKLVQVNIGSQILAKQQKTSAAAPPVI